ncbi:MAG: dihydrolipoamide acetyltransferase family protein [Nanoarchaeota archaeon]|nr:dihydrolipoamide acetyltransferase family protein [Nanoarchaeota archaeon]
MIKEFIFPDIGEGITEGELVEWLVNEGDKVKKDQPVAKVETDKALVDIPAAQDGIILKLHAKAKDTIKVGAVLITFGDVGDASPTRSSPVVEQKKSVSVMGELEESDRVLPVVTVDAKDTSDKRIKVLPALRKFAAEQKVDIAKVIPSGVQGEITKNDILNAKNIPINVSEVPKVKVEMKFDFYGGIEHVPVRGVRKSVMKKMQESWNNTVPVTHMDEVDVTHLVGIREREKVKAEKKGVKLTLLPFIIKTVVESLKDHPFLNASLEDEEIILKKYYNIGIAVDTDDGLIVPVIKRAEQKNVLSLAKEIVSLAQQAKSRSLDISDVKGGTFTITNVGSLGGVFSTPIINYPETAILAVGRVVQRPVVEDDQIVARFMLPLSLTFNHMVLDGAEAARFMNKVKESLADPDWLLLEL